MPGHEIAGVVTSVGAKVTELKVGQNVAVGVLVDSCRKCTDCESLFELHKLRTLFEQAPMVTNSTATRGQRHITAPAMPKKGCSSLPGVTHPRLLSTVMQSGRFCVCMYLSMNNVAFQRISCSPSLRVSR